MRDNAQKDAVGDGLSTAHTDRVTSLSIVVNQPLDMDKVNYFLQAILEVKG